MPTVSVKVNITDRDRAAFAHRMGQKGATLPEFARHLRQVCYEVLADYKYEYELDTNPEHPDHG